MWIDAINSNNMTASRTYSTYSYVIFFVSRRAREQIRGSHAVYDFSEYFTSVGVHDYSVHPTRKRDALEHGCLTRQALGIGVHLI